jgi:hypothetical protein
MTAALLALSCPRCAAGAEARRAFWENAPLEQLTIALLPFLVVALTSFAVARYGSSAERP